MIVGGGDIVIVVVEIGVVAVAVSWRGGLVGSCPISSVGVTWRQLCGGGGEGRVRRAEMRARRSDVVCP